jgi:Uma2 family endonuclease
MTTDTALAAIFSSPLLPRYAKQLNDALAQETALRERFYDEITESQKAEFINGEVIVHSPAKVRHVDVSGLLFSLLRPCVTRIGGRVMGEKALCTFTRNDYEPDIVYFGHQKAATISKDMMKLPVPDFIAEVLSDSTEKYDRGVKFKDYAVHGVQEYWIIDPRDEVLEQYLLGEKSEYSLKLKSTSGDVTSQVLGGLTIPIRAMFDEELQLETMTRLVASLDKRRPS